MLNNPKKPLLIIGTGGHCNSVIDVIECINEFELKGLVAKNTGKGECINGYPILGSDEDLPMFHQLGFSFVIGVGQIKSNFIRKSIFEFLVNLNANLPNIFSPFSRISSKISIGIGNSFMHDVVINANSIIGDNCIVNTKVLIEHDVAIGSNNHISTGAIINGGVEIGDNCFIGSGSTVSNNISICNNVIIGAGSVIVKNISEPGIYLGNPLRKI